MKYTCHDNHSNSGHDTLADKAGNQHTDASHDNSHSDSPDVW